MIKKFFYQNSHVTVKLIIFSWLEKKTNKKKNKQTKQNKQTNKQTK